MKSIQRCLCALIVPLAVGVSLVTTGTSFAQPTIAIVRVDGGDGSITTDNPGPDGSAWGAAAFRFLQDGLEKASDLLADFDQVQVWVRGDDSVPVDFEYRPDQGANQSGDPRTRSFNMHANVFLYGGFDTTMTDLAERNPARFVTILTGDIGTQDDILDNSFHVVTAGGAAINLENCLLEGFIIEKGRAVEEVQFVHIGLLGGAGRSRPAMAAAVILS